MKQTHIDGINPNEVLTFLGCNKSADSRRYYLCGGRLQDVDYGDDSGATSALVRKMLKEI